MIETNVKITAALIPGFMFGIEFFNDDDFYERSCILDLFILRLIIDY